MRAQALNSGSVPNGPDGGRDAWKDLTGTSVYTYEWRALTDCTIKNAVCTCTIRKIGTTTPTWVGTMTMNAEFCSA